MNGVSGFSSASAALASALLMTAPGPAAAESPRPPSGGQVQALHDFAACILPYPEAVHQLLGTVPGSKAAAKVARQFSQLPCPKVAIDGVESGWTVRGAIYERLYEAEYGGAPPSSFKGVGWVDYTLGESGGGPRVKRKVDVQAIAVTHFTKLLLEYADCVVRMQPADADALLETVPGSAGEERALRVLMPALSACLAQNAKMQPKIQLLRAYIAEALYKLSQAKAGVPGILKASH